MMALETLTVLELVKQIISGETGYQTVVLADNNTPLFFDFCDGHNPEFNINEFDRTFMDTKIQVSKLGPGYQLIPNSFTVIPPVEALPQLKSLFYALTNPVTIPFYEAHSKQLTAMARNGLLPYRKDLTDALKSFYAMFDLQVVRLLEESVDNTQIGIVDCGVYDFSGNRAVGQNPELYIPLKSNNGYAVWIVFEVTATSYAYKFGVRTGPNVERIEIRPTQFFPEGLNDLIKFIRGVQNAL